MPRLPSVCLLVLLLAACNGDDDDEFPIGPGGTYAVDLRCTPYDTTPGGDFCGDEPYQNYFQCDARPGDECVPAPHPSADPDQTAWCCAFPCTRYEVSDYRCNDGRAAYACTDDDPAIAEELGCVDGYDAFQICC